MASSSLLSMLGRTVRSGSCALVAGGALALVAGQDTAQEDRRDRMSLPGVTRRPVLCDGVIARVRTKTRIRMAIEAAKNGGDQDTWPWVWTLRQPGGSRCHVFSGNSPSLKKKMAEVLAREPDAAVMLVCPAEDMEKLGVLDKRIVRLDARVGRVDPTGGFLLTRGDGDDRVIEFDTMTVGWAPHAPEMRKPEFDNKRLEVEDRYAQSGPAKVGSQVDGGLGQQYGGPVAARAVLGCGNKCLSMVKRKSLSEAGEALHHIVQGWRVSAADTWPWVWLTRNPSGPLHVIVGSGHEALATAQHLSKTSPGSNVLIVGSRTELLRAHPEAEYDRCGAALVEGALEELDAAHGILMLDDERIIEFTSLTILSPEAGTAAA